MEVVSLTPRGYCHGVVRAIDIVLRAAKDPDVPGPIHVLGPIVHNAHVSTMLADHGVITLDPPSKRKLEALESIVEGTVVFTAHGIDEAIRKRASDKGLHIIDATCPDVKASFEVISSHVAKGRVVLFIGRKNHPESEAARSISPSVKHLENVEDVDALPDMTEDIVLLAQTTMSAQDIERLVVAAKVRFPNAIDEAIACHATRIRQEAVSRQDDDIELCIVVGDEKSHNTRKLVEISKTLGVDAIRVADADELPLKRLQGLKRVSVTSGASTPETVTKRVIEKLESL